MHVQAVRPRSTRTCWPIRGLRKSGNGSTTPAMVHRKGSCVDWRWGWVTCEYHSPVVIEVRRTSTVLVPSASYLLLLQEVKSRKRKMTRQKKSFLFCGRLVKAWDWKHFHYVRALCGDPAGFEWNRRLHDVEMETKSPKDKHIEILWDAVTSIEWLHPIILMWSLPSSSLSSYFQSWLQIRCRTWLSCCSSEVASAR